VKHQWWRDPELNLAQCAKHLGTNTSHLSHAINDGLSQNFNSLINSLRLDAVKGNPSDPGDSRDMLDIAFEAGFSSRASFNRSFKAIVGVTPTAFRMAAAPKKSRSQVRIREDCEWSFETFTMLLPSRVNIIFICTAM